MQIENHQLIDQGQAYDLPRLPHEAQVRAWRVPTEYRESGLFIAVKISSQPWDAPACKHGAPAFEGLLPADADVALLAEQQRLRVRYAEAIQLLLDSTAKRYEFDGIHTAIGWADSWPIAAALKAWGKACWDKSDKIRDAVLAGERGIPTEKELLAELPEFVG